MLSKTKRLMAVFLTALLSLSALPSAVSAVEPNGLKTTDGSLLVEAESLEFDTSRLATAQNPRMYSGGKALTVNYEDKEEKGADEPADIDLSFEADVAGTYTVWLRSTATTSSGDSIFISVGDSDYLYTGIKGQPGIPNWGQIASVSAAAGETARVRLKTRQSQGIALDVFYITCEEGFRPEDYNMGMDDLIGVPHREVPEPHKVGKDGYLLVEAEEMDYNTGVLALIDDADASGEKALRVLTEDKTVPDNAMVADMDISFIPEKAGTYYVWMRTKSAGSDNGNSIFLSVGDGEEYAYTGIVGTPTEYAWGKIATVTLEAGETGYVRVCRRQANNIRFDKFIITDDVVFIPQGKDDSPAEQRESVLPSNLYPMPEVVPTAGQHPRLWFQSDDIPTIRENMQKEQNLAAAAKMRELADSTFTPAEEYNPDHWAIIEAKAFDSAVNGNLKNGREAYYLFMEAAKLANYSGDNFEVRQYCGLIVTGAKVYDWCYNVLRPEMKKNLLQLIESKCYNLDPVGWPPTGGGAVTGHAGEGLLMSSQISFAIAVYDERPDIYNCVAGRFFEEFVPVRNYWYQSHAFIQGNAYGPGRFGWDLIAASLFKHSLGVDVFDMENMHMVLYEAIYNRRPDGQKFHYGDNYNSGDNYWSVDFYQFLYAADLFDDPYFKWEAARQNPNWAKFSGGEEVPISSPLFLIINNPDMVGTPRDDLPLTSYMGSPNGQMIARSGWEDGRGSDDVLAYMRIGELFAANHMHLDMGNFMLYYKGILASDSGKYGLYGTEHHDMYQNQAVAHNVVTVRNPNKQAVSGQINDGGYRKDSRGEPQDYDDWVTSGRYDMAEVIGHEYGPDLNTPEYNYIAGDLTKSYGDEVSESLRSMIYLPLDDPDHPGALVVMDKVTASDASYEKNWLLHMEEEPAVEGNKTIVTRTENGYNGRMVNETLLPKNPDIEKIGGEGKQFWVVDRNVEISNAVVDETSEVGWGRVEIGPTEQNETDYFLNVMTVSDADTTAPDIESQLVETDQIAGAVFAGKAVVFNKNKERISDSLTFTLPDGEYDLFLSGLQAGTWDVNGKTAVATEDGGCIYVDVTGGEITLTRQSDEAEKNFTDNKIIAEDEIKIMINDQYIYSDNKPVIKEDRVLVPFRTIFETLNLQVDYDEATGKISADDGYISIEMQADSKTAYVNGLPVELDVPSTMIDDRLFVPIRFVSEACDSTVEWDETYQTVRVKTDPGRIDFTPLEENAIKVRAAWDSGSNTSEDTPITACLDGKLSTRWAIDGDDYETAWGVFDFGESYNVDKISIAFHESDRRIAYFTIQFSEDGENWVTVLDKAQSNGEVAIGTYEDFDTQGMRARYVRYLGGGNSNSTWNSPLEIRFYGTK